MKLLINLIILESQESLTYNIIKDFVFPIFLAFISAITAYYLFFRQILNDKKLSEENKKEELKNKLTYFALTIHNAINNIETQNQHLHTLIEQLKNSEIDSVRQIVIAMPDLKIIVKKMDLESYLLSFLDYYSTQNKIQNATQFKIIVDSCSLSYEIFKQNDKSLENKLKIEMKGKIKLSEKIYETAKNFDKCLQKMKIENSPFLAEFIKINDHCYLKLPEFREEILKGQYYLLIVPLFDFFNSLYKKNIKFDDNLEMLWITVKDAFDLYDNLRRNNYRLLQHLQANYNTITQLINDIDKNSNNLRYDFLS